MYKVGVIGREKITQMYYIPEYLANPEAEVAGCFDLNTQRAQELSAAYGGRVYASYQEMLNDPAIDVVSVCTVNTTHVEIATAALYTEKHILCKKPIASTLEECGAMVAVARETGRLLMIGHNQGLTRAHILAKQLAEEGMIRGLFTFCTIFGHGGPGIWSIDTGGIVWFFNRKRVNMGAMADLGIRKIDLIQFLLGQKVVEVTARLTILDKAGVLGNLIGVDDNAVCIYRLSGSAIGTMTASWVYYGVEDNSITLYGTRRILRIYGDPGYAIQLIGPNGEIVLYRVDRIQTNDSQTGSDVIDRSVAYLGRGGSDHLSGKVAFSVMHTAFVCIESSQTGRTVAVHQEGNEIG